jgi:hypothetical protein
LLWTCSNKKEVDTRQKIVDAAQAAQIAARGATVVSGTFDPLVASHAARLAELKRDGAALLVLITSHDQALLPSRARAELVAGLRVVDFVTESPDGIMPQVRLEPEHAARLGELIEHVHARQAAR